MDTTEKCHKYGGDTDFTDKNEVYDIERGICCIF